MDNTPTVECAYCSAHVEELPAVPAADDDATWRELANEHNRGCEWVLTRAGSWLYRVVAVCPDGSVHRDEEHLGDERVRGYGTRHQAEQAAARLDRNRPDGHDDVAYLVEDIEARDLVSRSAAALGARGGRVRSDAKAAASRANGAKGGRPRTRVWTTRRDARAWAREHVVAYAQGQLSEGQITEASNAMGDEAWDDQSDEVQAAPFVAAVLGE